MEDFDYIDSLAKGELSGREEMPSSDGWNIVQEKLQRKKKKRRLLLLLLLFVVMSSVGIYQGVNFNSAIDANSVTNTNSESDSNSNSSSISNSDSTSSSDSDSSSTSDPISDSNNISQAEKDALRKNDDETQVNHQVANTIHGSEKSSISAESKVNSSASNTRNNTIYNGDENLQNDQSGTESGIAIATADEGISAEAKGLQLYAWELISPEVLKKERRKKRKKSIKLEPLYKNMDIMVGLNGFFTPNDYQVFESYVIEISYEVKRKLKNDFSFNYGAGLQLRNLRFKNDSIRFNSGELSFNLFSNIEKRYGDYSVEAGAYLGYEIYSPNNKFFNNKVKSFFDQKVNYGLSTGINYKNVGLIFKYELSPYVNYLGDKKYGGFIIGLKYDF